MNRKKIMLCIAILLAATPLFSNLTFASTTATQSSSTSVKIDNKVVYLTGTITSKPTNDGTAYFINTADGAFSVIGPNVKSISSYANTDKKVIVTGNPAVGAKIIVMTGFTDYKPTTPPAPVTPPTPASQTPSSGVKIDNKVIYLTGTITSKPTNDGTAYFINTADGVFSVIGPNIKSISSYANTDKKVIITGNPAVGAKIIVMTGFTDYKPTTPPAPVTPPPTQEKPTTPPASVTQTPPVTNPQTPSGGIKIDNKVVYLTGTITSKPTNDGTGYFINTSDGVFSVIGPNVKSISNYANTDKKVIVTGNPAVGAKIIVMTGFTEYKLAPPPAPVTQTPPVTNPQTPSGGIKIDNKVVYLTGTITSKPTNDGTAYFINTAAGGFSIIGPNAKSISSYANTDKKVIVAGNPAIGANIIVMISYTEYSSVTK